MSQFSRFKRFTVTSALPYANGPIHIGHLAGDGARESLQARESLDVAVLNLKRAFLKDQSNSK